MKREQMRNKMVHIRMEAITLLKELVKNQAAMKVTNRKREKRRKPIRNFKRKS
jgi:hypothetical protein